MTNHVEFPGLGLSFTLNRVAFTLFGMPVYWYGILIASGLLLALLFAFWKARSYGIDADRMVDVIFGATVCAIIGGRAYYVATAPFEYESFAQMLDIRLGGVGIYGAIIAAFVSGWLLCKWRKVPVLPMFDLASMGFLIGQCIGRWGNFVNQEAFGTNTTLPWGMISENTTAYLSSVQATLAAQGITVDPNLPVHPTFLYESLWCLVGFLLLAAYEKHRRFHGEVMLMYVMWYGLGRFFIEGLRTDSLMVGPFRISQVVAAASEEGRVVTNGMSFHARAGKNANAAVVVSVGPQDFDGDAKKAIAFQRALEQRAYAAGGGGYAAPAQSMEGFLSGRAALAHGAVQPTYPRGVRPAELGGLLGEELAGALRAGLRAFGRKLPGYTAPGAVLTGLETRTSSPVRLARGDGLQSPELLGVYPCGEGAGYAGGIMSAAVDGVRVALAIAEKYHPAGQ